MAAAAALTAPSPEPHPAHNSGLSEAAAKKKWDQELRHPQTDKEQVSSNDAEGAETGLVPGFKLNILF